MSNFVYNEAYAAHIDPDPKFRYFYLRGGAGSGKSDFWASRTLERVLTEEHPTYPHRIWVFRKVASTLKRSSFQLLLDVAARNGVYDAFEVSRSRGDLGLTCKMNGNQILFAGLDDHLKLQSITNPTSAVMEELFEFDYADLLQVDSRMRDKNCPYHQEILGAFNPISEDSWIKTKLFDAPNNETKFLTTTYLDNAFVNDATYRMMERRKLTDPEWFRIYGMGEWGVIATGDEFYKSFKLGVNTTPQLAYDKYQPIHLTFDFNVAPYVTCCVWVASGGEVCQIDEVLGEHPNNDTAALCALIARKYADHQGAMFIYGDPAGASRSTRGADDFKIIMSKLRKFHPESRVAKFAPGVAMRGSFINALFRGEIEDCFATIDMNCKETIDDYQLVKEAADGTKVKSKVKDPKTGSVYEPRGHCSDANDYFLTSYFKREFNTFVKGEQFSPIIKRRRR